MKVLLVGGTGVISSGIVKQLVEDGHDPVVLSRGSRKPSRDGVATLVADKGDRAAFVKQMQDQRFDAVIDMISFNSDDVQTTIEAFEGRADHIVVCSTIAAYKRPYASLPVREDAESLWDDPDFGYAYNKAQMEKTAMAAWTERQVPITLIRPSLTFGVGGANLGTLRQNYGIVDRIRRGRPLVLFGDACQGFSFTFVPDLARAFVGVLGKSAAFGQAYHATSEEPTIWKDFYLTFGRLLGKEVELAYIPSAYLKDAKPELFAHLNLEKTYDGLFSNDKLRSIIPGFRAQITLEEGLRDMLTWWEESGATADPEKDRMEELLAEHARRLRDDLKKALA